MKLLYKILLGSLLLLPTFTQAAVTFPINGGTGSSTLTGILLGAGTSPVQTLQIGNGLQLLSGILSSTGVTTFGTSSLSALAPLVYTQSSSLAQFSITQAGTGANGYLSSTDFNTFNNKISSTSLSGTGGTTYNSTTGVISSFSYPFPSNATTTALTLGGLTLSNLAGGGTLCVHVNNSGTLSTTASDCGSSGGTVTSVTASNPLFSSGGTTPNISTIFSTTTTFGLGNNGFLVTGATGIPFTAASSTLNLPNAALQNSSITVNGTVFNLGDSKTITAASSTLLGDNNTFSGNDTFNNTITGSVSGNAGTATKLATGRTIAITGDLTYTSPSFDGSSNITAAGTIATNAVTYAKFQQVGANKILGNVTSATANVAEISTSTLFGTPTPGTILAFLNGQNSYVATTTFSSPLIYSGGNVTCQTATGSVPGCLAAADFTTFNGKQAAGNYITALTGDVTATGPGSVAATLATVNGNVGTFTYPSVTVNGKGLITAISNGTTPTTYTGTFPIQVTGSVISSLFSTTTNSGMAQGFQYIGSGGIFQTAASSSLFGYTPLNPTRNINTTAPLGGGGNLTSDLTLTCASCSTFAFPFTPTSYGNATGTLIGFTNGILVVGSSTIVGNATTTGMHAFGNVRIPSLATAAGQFAAFDPNGVLVGTTTPINTGGSSEGVQWATAAVLGGTPTYSNGTAGVGATLTEVGTGALAVDGNSPASGDRVLVKNQASAFQNGIYTVTVTGSGIASYVLTRSSDYNSNTEITPGLTTYVVNGTANLDTNWAVNFTVPLTMGTTNLNYSEVSGGGAAVTSVSNSDSTLTITPTTGNVVASLNLGHANVWSALQQFNGNASTTALTVSGLTNLLGNVGIGTTTSNKLLVVEGNQSGGVMRVQRDFSASANQVVGTYDVQLNELGGLFDSTGPAQTFSISNNGQTPTIMGDISAVRAGADNTGSISLRSYNAGSPGFSTLTVDGRTGTIAIGSTTPGVLCTQVLCTTNSAVAGETHIAGTTAPVISSFVSSFTGLFSAIGTITNHPFFFFTNNTERMRLTASGLFGIGTTTPQWIVNIASSTAAQLALSSNSANGNFHWTVNNIFGNLFFATSSATTFATSTNSDPNTGYIEFPNNGGCIGCTDIVLAGGINLRNAKYVLASSTGETLNTYQDIYTAPTGKRALITNVFAYDEDVAYAISGSVKISGVYYPLSATTSLIGAGQTGNITPPPFVLESGESYSIITNTTTVSPIWVSIIEYDASDPLFTARALHPAAATSTLYAVPSNVAGAQLYIGPVVSGTLNFKNTSTAAVISRFCFVKNGQNANAGTHNCVMAPTSVNANVTSGTNLSSLNYFGFSSGDSIVYKLGTDLSSTNSIIWATVDEH